MTLLADNFKYISYGLLSFIINGNYLFAIDVTIY